MELHASVVGKNNNTVFQLLIEPPSKAKSTGDFQNS